MKNSLKIPKTDLNPTNMIFFISKHIIFLMYDVIFLAYQNTLTEACFRCGCRHKAIFIALNLRGETFAGRKIHAQNVRDLLSRMRSLEYFCRDKLSRLDVKYIKFCLFNSECLRFSCFLKEKIVLEHFTWE